MSLYAVIIGFSLAVPIFSQENDSIQDIIESILDPSVYNRKERPNLSAGIPVNVGVSVFVSSISDISEITMDYSINMFLRQTWKDPRLAFQRHTHITNDTVSLNYLLRPLFWLPDLYFRNERSKGVQHDITVPNVLLTLAPDGTVFYSQRISSVLSCQMKLNKYPLDIQTCVVQMESYGFSTRDVIFEWIESDAALEVNDIVELPEFNITSSSKGLCTAVFSTGTFSCVYIRFVLERLFQFYLIQVYVPSILIVVLSWVSFWIDINAVPARISLGLLTVLTITTQSSGISAKLPRVSYIKAIDVWMFTNTVFVFGALIEYSIVNVLARTHKAKLEAIKKKREKEELQKVENDAIDVNEVNLTENSEVKKHTFTSPHFNDLPHEKKMSWLQHVKFNRALLVDAISRIGFPASYVIFNVLYWVFYTN